MIKRELYLSRVRKLIDKEEIKVITGVRRCGKTVFLKMIIDELLERGVNKENIIYISFESAKYDNINNYKDLNKTVFDKTKDLDGKVYLLFDEIQNVENWEKSINAYRVDLVSDIYVTGSNSKLLMGEYATLLTGRYISIHMFPFSYKEMLDYENKNNPHKNEVEIFQDYLSYGGFPALLKYDKSEKEFYLRDLYDSILVKDIIMKNKIGNVDLIKKLIIYIITTIGQSFSSSSISKYLKNQELTISPKTILNYLSLATDSLLLYKSRREDLKGKEILKTLEKYYVVDPGFYYVFKNEDDRSMDSLLENIIYIELLKRSYQVTIGKMGNLEIDFVCKKPGKTIYIQVSQTIMDPETRKREVTPLLKINDNYPKYILTLDDLKYPTDGIIQMNIRDFLKDYSI